MKQDFIETVVGLALDDEWQRYLRVDDVYDVQLHGELPDDVTIRISVPVTTCLRTHFCADRKRGLCVTDREQDIESNSRRHHPVSEHGFEYVAEIAGILNSVASAVNAHCRAGIMKMVIGRFAACKQGEVIDLDEKGNVQTKGTQP